MPTIQRTTSVPANDQVRNTLAESAFEIAFQRWLVALGVTAAATGTFVNIQSGPDIVAEEFEPAILTRFPIIPDEIYYNDVMEVGDRLRVSVRNGTGAAIIVRTLAQISAI